MRVTFDRIPSADDLARHRAKLAGFAAGVVGTLLLGLFIGVLYSGESAFANATPDEKPVYPAF